MFLGIHLQPGHSYKGDVLAVSLSDFMSDADGNIPRGKVHVYRIKAEEVRFPLKGEEHKFPLAEARNTSQIARIKYVLENEEISPEIPTLTEPRNEDFDDPEVEEEDQDEEVQIKFVEDSSLDAPRPPNEQSGGSSSSTSLPKRQHVIPEPESDLSLIHI